MKTIQYVSLSFLAVLLMVFAHSCSDNGLTNPENNEQTNAPATLKVVLTDAPGDFESVFVDIREIRVHKVTDSTYSDTTNEDEGWITISEEPLRVDLLTLQNGNTITLGETEIDTGAYDQMRLILGDDNEVVVDGESHYLKTPSAQQSGLKLKIDADIEAGKSYTLLVDFDASRSIVKTGNGHNPNFNYLLKPVLRAVSLEETGSLSGIVEPSEFATSVYTVVDEDTIGTTTADDGSFQILGLAAGMYDVTFEPDSSGFRDTTLTDIEVFAGEDTDLGTITLQEN